MYAVYGLRSTYHKIETDKKDGVGEEAGVNVLKANESGVDDHIAIDSHLNH